MNEVSIDLAAILAGVKWDGLLQVTIASIGFTLVTVALFALGMRLLGDAEFAVAKASKGKAKAIRVEVLARSGAYMLFALCGLILLYGIYLVVPYFHLSK